MTRILVGKDVAWAKENTQNRVGEGRSEGLRFLHLSLLGVALLIEKLCTETVRLLSELGTLVHHTCLTFAPVQERGW